MGLHGGLRGSRGDRTGNKTTTTRIEAPQRGSSRVAKPPEYSNHATEPTHNTESFDAAPVMQTTSLRRRGARIHYRPKRREIGWSTAPEWLTGDLRWPQTTVVGKRGGERRNHLIRGGAGRAPKRRADLNRIERRNGSGGEERPNLIPTVVSRGRRRVTAGVSTEQSITKREMAWGGRNPDPSCVRFNLEFKSKFSCYMAWVYISPRGRYCPVGPHDSRLRQPTTPHASSNTYSSVRGIARDRSVGDERK